MNLLELVLGQIPEAIYFALFMTFTKEIKTKRIPFLILMVLEYILLMKAFPYSMWSHILFFVITYIIMKMLYKEKCQITDIFTLGIASLVLIITSAIPYFIIWFTINNYLVYVILNRLLLFGLLLIMKNKLPKIKNMYKKLWNRNDKTKKKMKSATFRATNVVVFNIMFLIINLGMLFMLSGIGGV